MKTISGKISDVPGAVTLIDAETETPVPAAPKEAIAEAILEKVDALRGKTASQGPRPQARGGLY